MEVLGAVASVLGIATAALQLSQSSYELIDSFRSQRKDVHEIQDDLRGLIAVLQTICEQARDANNDDKLRVLGGPLQCCRSITQEMYDMLQQCTKHAKDHRESVRTWLSLRYREKSFDDARQRLSSYKSTLTIAFDSINLANQRVVQTSLEELEKTAGRTKEELEDQLHQLQQQIGALDLSLHRTLEDDRAQIEACLRSLEEAQKTRATRARVHVAQNIASGQNTRLIAGTDMEQPTVDLSVIENRAEGGAAMAAGVHSPETLRLLLQQSSASADARLLFNAMQTHSSDPSFWTTPGLLGSRAGGQHHLSISGRIDESPALADTIASTVEERSNVSTTQGRR